MSYLILVRHSISTQQKDRPAHEWGLTEEGQHRCQLLAQRLEVYEPDIFVTSVELKARLTGEMAAQILGKPVITSAGLHEHERHGVGWFATSEEFEAAVINFFRQPDQLVFGEETADGCLARYSAAVERVVREYGTARENIEEAEGDASDVGSMFGEHTNIALVSHGTVMALFIAGHNGIDPVPLWRDFEMPAFVVLSRPDYKIVEIVNDVTA